MSEAISTSGRTRAPASRAIWAQVRSNGLDRAPRRPEIGHVSKWNPCGSSDCEQPGQFESERPRGSHKRRRMHVRKRSGARRSCGCVGMTANTSPLWRPIWLRSNDWAVGLAEARKAEDTKLSTASAAVNCHPSLNSPASGTESLGPYSGSLPDANSRHGGGVQPCSESSAAAVWAA